MAKRQWTARLELFTVNGQPWASWVLVDPEGLIRARFYGGAENPQGKLAVLIANLLTAVECLF